MFTQDGLLAMGKKLVGADNSSSICSIALLDTNGTEISGNNYARFSSNDNSLWTISANTVGASQQTITVQNARPIYFNDASPNAWGTIGKIRIYVSSTKYYEGDLTQNVSIGADTRPRFAAGALKITIAINKQ